MKSATRNRFPRPAVLGVLLFAAVLFGCDAHACDFGPFPDYPFPVSPEPRCADAADSGSIPTETTLSPGSKPLSGDAATLAAFYNATDGPNWRDNTRWLTDAPISDWSGVTASNIVNGGVVGECVVRRLDLSYNQLSGEIPAELANLAHLYDLDLSDNQLSGEIPAELGNLPNLGWLDLSDNQLSGEIPAELGNLPNLGWLDLSDNQLSGEIPAELANLSNLYDLDLSDNQLSGEIPAELGNLPKLEELYLSYNQLSGEIPVELGNVPNLSLDGNQLRGRILRPYGINPQYAWDGSTILVSWDAADGADYYKVYYDDISDSHCSLSRDGSPLVCEELAANVVGTSYLHENPSAVNNYYWVVACNSDGCSEIDSEYHATPIEPIVGLANVTYAVEGSAIRVTWEAVPGADYYKVYYDELSNLYCSLRRDGSLVVCEELAANVVGVSYLHENPSAVNNYYWVVACNSGGCSEIDSGNPAAPIEPIPAGLANVTYAVEGSAIRVTWEAVPGADYYKVYYDELSYPYCSLSRDGSPVVCEELAANVVGMSYLHENPSAVNNHFWVVACNSGGCSDIDSKNPAKPIETRPNAPAATPSSTGGAGELAQERAAELLAGELGVAVAGLKVVSTTAMTWSDASLGCPQPDMGYAQVVTPGYLVLFRDSEGTEYKVHTNEDGSSVIVCDK